MNPEQLLLGFPGYTDQGKRLANYLNIEYKGVEIHRFPDGESRLCLPPELPYTVILCRSLDHPNDKLVELFLAAAGARELGAQRLILVAPYLCYMRQDKAFHPGEVVSQHVIGQQLARYFDGLLTVDSHLHRIHRLSDAIPTACSVNVTATRPMAAFLLRQLNNPMLIGPDAESEQWVAAIAGHEGLDFQVASKERFGDREVRVTLPSADYRGRDLVLVDDVASTGRTLVAAARALSPFRPASISVLVAHALFAGDAIAQLKDAGVAEVWSCDSIPHSSNRVFLDELLGNSLRDDFQIVG